MEVRRSQWKTDEIKNKVTYLLKGAFTQQKLPMVRTLVTAIERGLSEHLIKAQKRRRNVINFPKKLMLAR